jgi:hypothetical protein
MIVSTRSRNSRGQSAAVPSWHQPSHARPSAGGAIPRRSTPIPLAASSASTSDRDAPRSPNPPHAVDLAALWSITHHLLHYAGFYARGQSLALNRLLPRDRQIPGWFISLVLNLQIASGLAFVALLFVEDGHPVEELSKAIDFASGVGLLIWGFVARSRANFLLESERGDSTHFSALWTWLLTPLYFNYKVNSIADADYPVASRTAA